MFGTGAGGEGASLSRHSEFHDGQHGLRLLCQGHQLVHGSTCVLDAPKSPGLGMAQVLDCERLRQILLSQESDLLRATAGHRVLQLGPLAHTDPPTTQVQHQVFSSHCKKYRAAILSFDGPNYHCQLILKF